MQDAANHFDLPYFNKIDADTNYRDAIPYIDAIPRAWWHDMRIASRAHDGEQDLHVGDLNAAAKRTRARSG